MIPAHTYDITGRPDTLATTNAQSQNPARHSARAISRPIVLALFAGNLILASAQVVAAAEFRPVKGEPGLSYKNDKVASEPWSIHVLQIDRGQKDLTFYSAHAREKVLGVSILAEQARNVPRELGKAIAVINGDFYLRDNPTYAGDPRGLQIVNGELISGPDTVCVWFDPQGNPHLDEVTGDLNVTWADGNKTPIGLNQPRRPGAAVLYTPTYGLTTRTGGGRELVLERDGDSPWLPLQASQTYRTRVREVRTNGNTRFVPDAMVLSIAPQLLSTIPVLTNGSIIQISTALTPDLKGVKSAIGGGPTLIRDGKPAFTSKSPPPGSAGDWSQRSKYERHPRAAVGWSSTHIYFVIIDGRQPGLSVGMKLFELADYMLAMGCTAAMNLDGGKSAQMWLNGRIMNSPAQGEDTVANSLLVVRKAEAP